MVSVAKTLPRARPYPRATGIYISSDIEIPNGMSVATWLFEEQSRLNYNPEHKSYSNLALIVLAGEGQVTADTGSESIEVGNRVFIGPTDAAVIESQNGMLIMAIHGWPGY